MTSCCLDKPVILLLKMAILQKSRLHLLKPILQCKREKQKLLQKELKKLKESEPGKNFQKAKKSFLVLFISRQVETKILRLSEAKVMLLFLVEKTRPI